MQQARVPLAGAAGRQLSAVVAAVAAEDSTLVAACRSMNPLWSLNPLWSFRLHGARLQLVRRLRLQRGDFGGNRQGARLY